jgi:hypothetical protein
MNIVICVTSRIENFCGAKLEGLVKSATSFKENGQEYRNDHG